MAAYAQAMFAAIVRQHQALTSRVSAHPEPDRANLAGGAERRYPPRSAHRQPRQPGRVAARPPAPGCVDIWPENRRL